MIHVLAIVTAKKGQRSKALEIFKANVPAVHAEDGCIEYTPVVDVDDAKTAFGEDTFVVVEKWRDRDALKAHAAAPHMKAYSEKVREFIESTAVHVLQQA